MVEMSSTEIPVEIKAHMKKALKKDRWEGLNLGAPANYTSEAVQSRWEKSRKEWLSVSN